MVTSPYGDKSQKNRKSQAHIGARWRIGGASGDPSMSSIVHAVNPMIRLLNFPARVLTGPFALWVLLTVAHADAPYSFATTPGQLPKTVAPVHYTLDLQPNLEALPSSAVGRASLQRSRVRRRVR